MGQGTEAASLAAALELFETGVEMMRQNLRRQHPEASDAEIEAKLGQWLRHRPGAALGDSSGRPRHIPGLDE